MPHYITEILSADIAEISTAADVDAYFAVSGGALNKGRHGFAILFETNGSQFKYAFPSDTIGTTSRRAVLAATLTALEWRQLHCTNDNHFTIHTCENYIYDFLCINLRKWVRDPKRPHLDLLKPIFIGESAFETPPHYVRIEKTVPIYAQLQQLARDAADSGLPSFFDDEQEFDGEAFQRALDRDRL